MAVSTDFTSSSLDLNGKASINGPTALVWGPDGRLYVTEVSGDVNVLTVAFGDKNPGDGDNTAKFYVTDAETLGQVKAIPGHNDDGSTSTAGRQVTGIDVTQQFDGGGNPVILANGKPAVNIYVTSSDARIGAGGGGGDTGLDTNSGMITRLSETESGWDTVDLVRGLSRSEENHATNGLEVIQELNPDGTLASERIIVANGGNANTGAPSNNFAGQQETAYSAAILEVDLDELNGMTPETDAVSGRAYIYDLPTLNDPTRAGDPDNNDPFGGHDGINGGKLIDGGPVQIYSAGYRNAFDIEVTEDGRVWTYDNGANNGWGGRPAGEDDDADSTEIEPTPDGYIATNLGVDDNSELGGNFNPKNRDGLQEITRSDDLLDDNGILRQLSAGQGGAHVYQRDHPDFDGPLTLVYGGHPNPTRAEGARAGLLYSPNNGITGSKLMVSNVEKPGGSSDFLEVVDWLQQVGYSESYINETVVAVDPGVTYADTFASGFGTGARPTTTGVFSLVADANGPIGIPSDIDEIVETLNSIEGDYLEAGYTDGSVDTNTGSINGLAEYTSTLLDKDGVKMSGALFASNYGGGFLLIGRNEDGIVETEIAPQGYTVAEDKEILGGDGKPLGLAAIGDDVSAFGGQKAFQGSVWAAVYGQNGPIIEIFQPGNPDDNALLPVYAGQEPSDPTDHDLDGIDHVSDPFEFSATNGYALEAGGKLVLDFQPSPPNPDYAASLAGIGLLGGVLDGTTPNRDELTATELAGTSGTPEDGLFNNGENLILGANGPQVQIKNVGEGTAIGGANSLRDAVQTGVNIAPDVQRLVAELDIANWASRQFSGDGRVTGMMFGDGTQSNFVRFAFGDVGAAGGPLGLEVGIETGDSYSVLATVTDAGFTAALTGGDPAIDSEKVVTLQLEIADIGGSYTLLARYKTSDDAGFTSIDLGGESLPAGVLRDVLDGTHTITDANGDTAPSGAAVALFAENEEGVTFDAVDFNEIRIEAFGNEIAASDAAGVAQGGTAGLDTVVYDGTDTDLALANDVENFDGSASGADYALTANGSDNVITVGAGANTITTGAGNDSVQGSLADLAGDTITDFSTDDEVLVKGFTTSDIDDVTYAAGSAIVTINGSALTFDGPDFATFDPADGPGSFTFEDTEQGLRITSRAPLSPVVAINAGGTGNFSGTLRDTDLTFVGDEGGVIGTVPGVTMTGGIKDYTNGSAQSFDFPGTELDGLLASERSFGGDFGYSIDVPDGSYLIDFIFAEIFHGFSGTGGAGNGVGNRVFDVDVEGSLVFDDVDVFDEAGGAGQQLIKSYQVEVTDGTLDINFSEVVDQGKLSGMVVWSVGAGGFTPVDDTAPVIEEIGVENLQNVQDGTRTATLVLSDETGFAASDFDGIDGSVLDVTGIVPDSIAYTGVTLSNGGKTATLTFELSPPDGSWPRGAGDISVDAGAFQDAAGNGSAAASAGFVIEPFLDALTRGAVARAINLGTTAANVGTLQPDPLDGDAADNNSYGGAIASDTLITDAFGNPVSFEADFDAYHTSPKPSQNNNVDGNLGRASNAGGVDLDGSAYHTYRDSSATNWSSTYTGFANGSYIVELHFAELYQEANGLRVGDFTVNGVSDDDLLNLDVHAEAGGDTPYLVRVPVTVTDGTITVDVHSDEGQAGYSAIVVYDAVDSNLPAQVSVGDVTVAEGGMAELVFTRSGDLSEAVTIEYSLDGNSADASDFGAGSPDPVVIAAGQNRATVLVPITDDEDEEGAETISVTIDSATAGSNSVAIADGNATITIAASDSDLQAPVGATIFDLDFETAGTPLAEGGFDGALGGAGAIVAGDASVAGGKLVVQTANGDINQGGVASKNDFTKSVDLSDAGLTEIFLTTRFDNPFTEAELTSQGVTTGYVPNYAQQGLVIGTGDQADGEMVKLVFGGVAANGSGGADPTGVQMWTKGSGNLNQQATLAQMLEAGKGLFDIASVEMSLAIDKDAGTIAQYVTLFDETGATIGGLRPVATPGFFTAAPQTIPALVLANITDAAADTQAGVTSSDYNDFQSFDATWDFLRLSSPQFAGETGPVDSVNGVATAGDDFSDDGLAPTDLGVLTEGTTVIESTQQGDSAPGGRDRDYFTFTVAEGQELTGIVLDGYAPGETELPQGFIGLDNDGQIIADPVTYEDADTLLGGYIYNEGSVKNPANSEDGNLLASDKLGDGNEQGITFGDGSGFTAPLPAGTYTVWLNQGGPSSSVTLNLVTAPAATGDITLAIADAPDLVEAGDTGDTVLAFALSADGFTGDMDVTYSRDGTSGLTQSVAFTDGAGVLSIAVANDDADTSDTSVAITLEGASDAAATNIIVISTASASAAGTVTEDDIMDPVFERGDVVAAFNAGGLALTQDGIDFAAAPSGTDGAPFSDGDDFADNAGGNGPQPVYDGTIYETEINDGGDDATPGTFSFSTSQNIDPAKQYFVDLYFAEIYAQEVGERVFSVFVEGGAEPVLADYDLLAENGDADTPIVVQLTAPVSPGANGAIDLSFVAAEDRAKISGIVIREAVATDTTAVSVSVADVSVSEEAGVADLVFTRDGNTDTDMIITYSTADDSATAGADYTAAASQTVTILAGATSATASIALTGDALEEGDESFTVTIEDASADGATVTIADGAATVTLTDDDGVDPTDIDGDGVLNAADPFAYDAENGAGNVLTAGGSFRQDFDVDTTDVFDADGGFTGILVNQDFAPAGSRETDPYGDRTNEATSFIEDGVLKVTSSETDAFSTGTGANNTLMDNYQRAADVTGVDSFTLSAKVANPFEETGPNTGQQYQSLGLNIGAGGTDDFLKLVYGVVNDGPRIQLAHQNSVVGGEDVELLTGLTEAPSDILFTIAVDKSGLPGTAATLIGTVTLLDADGAEITSYSTPARTISGSFAAALEGNNPLTGGTGGIAYGIAITDWSNGAGNRFEGQWDYIELKGPEAVNAAPSAVALVPVITEIAEDADLAAPVKVADIAVTDDGIGTNTLALTGADAAAFEIVGTELFLKAETALDFETMASLDVAVTVDDADVGTTPDATSATLTLAVTDANEAPTLSVTPVLAEIAENADVTASTKVADIAVTDDALGSYELALSGDDAGLFEVVTVEGTGALELHLKAGAALDFETNGALDVTVTLDDATIGEAGTLEGSVPVSLTVLDANDAPTITGSVENVETTEGAATSVDLSALVLEDADEFDIPELRVELADGSELPAGLALNGTSLEAADTLAEGIYTINVFANDTQADSVSPVSFTITVGEPVNEGPVLGAEIADQTPAEDAAYSFTLPEGTFTDTDALSLSATLESGDPLPDWLSFDAATGTFSGTPTQGEVDAGALSVTVTATDTASQSISDTFTLTPENVNDAPVAVDDAGETIADNAVTFTVAQLLANDSDEDGDTLDVTEVRATAGGTVSLDGGIVTFTPEAGFTGTASFEYDVADGQGGLATGAVSIEVSEAVAEDVTDVTISGPPALSGYWNQDSQPNAYTIGADGASLTIDGNSWKKMALPEAYTVSEDTVLRVTFSSSDIGEIHGIGLENDNAPGTSEQLFFKLAGSQNWNQTDNTYATYTSVGETVTFEIDLGANAGKSYSHLVFINDADATTGNGTFADIQFVEPAEVNVAPEAGADTAAVTRDTVLRLTPAQLLANDSDANGDALSITDVSGATGGSVEIEAGSGQIVFTPDAGFTGEAGFVYTVSDGNGGTASANVSVDVLEEGAGEIVTDIDFSAAPITSYSFQDTRPGTGFTVSPDGDALTVDGNVWKGIDLPGEDYVVTENTVLRFDFTAPIKGEIHAIGLDNDDDYTNGAAIFQLAGSQNLVQADQTYRNYTDALSDEGAVVSYEIALADFAGQSFASLNFINDHDGAPRNANATFSGVQLVEILPTTGSGEAPQIFGGTIGTQTVTEDSPFEIILPIYDNDTAMDDLTFTYDGLPDFLSTDGTVLTGQPDNDDVGSYEITVTARDPELNQVSDTFTLSVENTNDAPELNGTLADRSAFLDSGLAIDLPAGLFSDPDLGDTLSYSLAGAPDGLTIDPATGRITGAPTAAGSFTISVIASDGALEAQTSFTLDVADGPPRESVLIEAESFTGFTDAGFPVDNFQKEFISIASGRQVIRTGIGESASISTNLAAAGAVAGFYDISVRHFDEDDGASTLQLLIDHGDGAGPQLIGDFVLDKTGLPGQGDTAQAGNIQNFSVPQVEIKEGSRLILQGVADDREVLRIDSVQLDPVAAPADAAPVFDSAEAVSVAENTVLATTVAATDPEDGDLSYALNGGADEGSFQIDPETGELSFAAAPDFEFATDADADGTYEVVVSASDGVNSTDQAVSVTVTDANEAPEGTAPAAQSLTQGEAAILPSLDTLFTDADAGDVLSYEVTGLPAGITLAADGITLEGTPSALGTSTVTVTATDADGLATDVSFDITVLEEGATDPTDFAPDGDLDGDGILNNVDDDVDGDGTLNADDAFAYDGENGMTLAAGETRSYDFDTDGTIYQNGLTGFLQGTTNGGDFDEDTGANSVSGGLLTVDPVTTGDTGGANNPEDDATVGVKNGSFTASAVVVNPWFGAAPNPGGYDQLGLVLGIDSSDMVKLVFGQTAQVVEFQVQQDGTGTKYPSGGNVALPSGAQLDDFAKAEITFEVTSTDASTASVTATVAFLAEDGSVITTESYGSAPIGGALAAALADAETGVSVGFTHVDQATAPGFVAQLDSLSITAAGTPVDPEPTGDDVVVYRINAGGDAIVATDDGPDWAGDSIAAPNGFLTVTDNRGDQGGTATPDIDGVPNGIFAEARSSSAAFSYDIPVSELGNGENYEVRLYFAEIFAGGQDGDFRNFDASVEGFTPAAFNDIDPGALYGAEGGMISTQIKVVDGMLNIGFTQDIKQNPIINGIEIVKLAGEVDGPPDPVDNTDALAILAAAEGVDDDGSYDAGDSGSATLSVMEGANNVQQSNYGANSFMLENTGDKQIAAVFVDFRGALYGDSIIDFDGSAGDLTFKKFEADNGAGATGAYFGSDGETYFLPGEDPLANTTGTGIASSGGWRGLLMKFDGSSGGFTSGESVGFAGDMDPNSIAALNKSGGDGVDPGAINGWDVGGVSGAELIGSAFTVKFDDGTTATGYLGSDGSQAGSVGTAVQNRGEATASVTVNGFTSAVAGTYGGEVPEIVVSGTPGDEVLVTLSRGLNPVTNTSNGIADLVSDRLAAAHPEFQASNAADFQTARVTIGSDGTATLSAGAFDYSGPDGGQDFSGSAFTPGFTTAPMVVGASVIGSDDTPLGPVDRVYLSNPTNTPVEGGDGGGGTPTVDGYYEVIGNDRFKIQIEDAGTNPGGKWSFEDAPDGSGNQSGFQGDGYYLFGSDTSTAINGVNANETLSFDIFVPEEATGTYAFRLRGSRDGTAPSDQQNDIWLNFAEKGSGDEIEDYLVTGSSEPEPTDNGFIKIFGGPNNGTWGSATNWDGLPGNPATQIQVDEAGVYTVEIAGRSQGFHVDYFELYKGDSPATGASDSTFIEGEPGDTGGGGGTPSGNELVVAIGSASDDVEQETGGGLSNKADLELGDGGRDLGLRFTDIDLAGLEGRDITDAWIEFTNRSQGGSSGALEAKVHLEDTLDAATYSGGNGPADRDSFDFVTWSDGDVPGGDEVFRTDDLSGMIETFLDDNAGDLGSSDDLGFWIEDVNGVRKAVSFEGGDAPELHIVFADDTPIA